MSPFGANAQKSVAFVHISNNKLQTLTWEQSRFKQQQTDKIPRKSVRHVQIPCEGNQETHLRDTHPRSDS